jgi:hypothetical protein
MVTLLTIQILAISATTLTNLLGILTFATDYWSTVVYDLTKLQYYAKFVIIEESSTGHVHLINSSNASQNMLDIHSYRQQYTSLTTIAIGMENNLVLYQTHKGVFRQCNDLSFNVRQQLNLGRCRILKTINNQYDDVRHGMSNPGRELIRKG